LLADEAFFDGSHLLHELHVKRLLLLEALGLFFTLFLLLELPVELCFLLFLVPLILYLLLFVQNVMDTLVIILVEGLLILFNFQILLDPTLLADRFLI